MQVEIWSDVVCPFCYIGKRRFEQALEDFAGKEQVEITWKSFQLDAEVKPGPGGMSVHAYLAQRKGVSEAEGKKMNDYMASAAQEVGLTFDFEKAVVTNTLNAHRLLHFAKKHGLQEDLKERLFAAYYTQGQDLGDVEVLVNLAQEVGLDSAEARAMLASDAYESDVQQDIYEAQQVGVRGVPFYVFNRKYAVSGAQPSSVFKDALEKAWEDDKPVMMPENSGGSCTVDGDCT